MKNQKKLFIFFATLALLFGCGEQKTIDYKDASLPVEDRVKDLLSKMTLEEKVAQMMSISEEVKDSIRVTDENNIDLGNLKQVLKHGIGQITRLSETKAV